MIFYCNQPGKDVPQCYARSNAGVSRRRRCNRMHNVIGCIGCQQEKLANTKPLREEKNRSPTQPGNRPKPKSSQVDLKFKIADFLDVVFIDLIPSACIANILTNRYSTQLHASQLLKFARKTSRTTMMSAPGKTSADNIKIMARFHIIFTVANQLQPFQG